MVPSQLSPKLRSLKRFVATPTKVLVLCLFLFLPIIAFYLGGWYFQRASETEQPSAHENVLDTEPSDEKDGSRTPPKDSKITSHRYQVRKECELSVTLNTGETILVPPETICLDDERLIQTSNFGEYLAFGGGIGGVDSVVYVYHLHQDSTVLLGVFGTSKIKDLLFVREDVLAVLSGYPGIPEHHWLSVYNIPEIFSDYSQNTTKISENLTKFDVIPSDIRYSNLVKKLPLPPSETAPIRLRISTEALLVDTEEKNGVAWYGLEDYGFDTAPSEKAPEIKHQGD